MIKTILVPLDGSALAEHALSYAAHLARATKGRLLLLHAASSLALLTRMEAELDISVRLVWHLDALRRSGIEATSRAADGPPVSAILFAAREDRVDLIVMATHGRGSIGRRIYGGVSDELLRKVGVPVLVVPPACDRRWSNDRPFRIMVPLDGSLHSETALGPARELAEGLGAELLLVRAIEEPSPQLDRFSPEGSPIQVSAGERHLNEARQYLEATAGQLGTIFASIDVLAEVGPAARVIADAARRGNVDLILLATHGRTGLERLALGSVATKVVQRAHVPVLLLRPARLSRRAAEKLKGAVHR